MKKVILLLVAFGTLTIVSCKKENDVKPEVKTQKVMGGEKDDMGGYD